VIYVIEVIDTVKSSQSLQTDQDFGKTHDLKDGKINSDVYMN